jgi:hypothetical protein
VSNFAFLVAAQARAVSNFAFLVQGGACGAAPHCVGCSRKRPRGACGLPAGPPAARGCAASRDDTEGRNKYRQSSVLTFLLILPDLNKPLLDHRYALPRSV